MKLREKKFQKSNIKFTFDEKRLLGGSFGTDKFKIVYVNQKVEEWCKELKNLPKRTKTQQYAAFSAYIHMEQHKFVSFYKQ